MPVVFSIGGTIGYVISYILLNVVLNKLCFSPFIGGTLARPYDRFPAFDNAFWEKYPYFLPCAVSAAYSLLCMLLGAVLVKEVFHF